VVLLPKTHQRIPVLLVMIHAMLLVIHLLVILILIVMKMRMKIIMVMVVIMEDALIIGKIIPLLVH
jgi:hypothetical protein